MAATGITATEKVLSTTELLENIFVHLPVRHLSSVQRVSRYWKATTTGSLKLQQGRFLTRSSGSPNDETSKDMDLGYHSKTLPPYNYLKNANAFEVTTAELLSAAVAAAETGQFILNPLIFSLFSNSDHSNGFTVQKVHAEELYRDRYAPWNSRFLSMPPTATTNMILQRKEPGAGGRLDGVLSMFGGSKPPIYTTMNRRGVTLGDVVATLDSMKYSETSTAISFDIEFGPRRDDTKETQSHETETRFF